MPINADKSAGVLVRNRSINWAERLMNWGWVCGTPSQGVS